MKLKASQIKPNPDNPRFIKDDKYKKLVKSLKDFPIMAKKLRRVVIDEDNVIIGGNMRYKAIIEAGLPEVYVEQFTREDAKENNRLAKELDPAHKDTTYEEQRREFIIKDNVAGGEWDWDRIANEWDSELLEGWGVDLPVGFGDEDVVEDEAPEVSKDPPQSILGAVYQLGRHKLMCGDATNEDDINKLLGEQTIYIFHADTEGYNFRASVKDVGWLLKQCLIWVKQTMVMGRQDYQWKHEPILYGWKSGSSHNWFADRTQTTILEFDRPSSSREHPTMKPISILAYLIKNSSKEGDIVFDNFLGSGSTLIACEQLDRICYGIEIDPKYCDVIRKRYWKFTHDNNEEGWEQGTAAIADEKQTEVKHGISA